MDSTRRDLLMVEGLTRRPRGATRLPRRALGLALLATPVVAGLTEVLPDRAPAQTQGSALEEVLAGGRRSPELRTLTVGMQARLVFSKNLAERVAVGDEAVLGMTVLGQRELLLLGGQVGRTTLTAWFADGTIEQFVFSVQRDLSVLDRALAQIHPAVQAEIAPDRDAIVLTGTVPDRSFAVAAQNAAVAYLEAGARRTAGGGGPTDPGLVQGADAGARSGQVINLIRWERSADPLQELLQREIAALGGSGVVVQRLQRKDLPDDSLDGFVVQGDLPDARTLANVTHLLEATLRPEQVVNQLTVEGLAMDIAGRIQLAITGDRELACPDVRVSRIPGPRQDSDVLVLQGSVPSQTKLTQVLALASRLFLQQDLVRRRAEGEFEELTEVLPNGTSRTSRRPLRLRALTEDLAVISDESGGLFLDRPLEAAQGVGRLRAGGNEAGGNVTGSSFGNLLSNGLSTNVARARALELADGRILSFLEVDDLPQVRVDVRLYEVNRQALLNWDPQTSFRYSDFQMPSRLRPGNVDPDTGQLLPGAPPTGNEDVSNLVQYMQGMLTNEFAISGNHVDLSALFSVLETEGIARSLSNPTLTVMSGEVAGFGVGGRIPVQEATLAGTGLSNQNVRFIGFGVNLAVRPLVGDGDWITLDVVPEISNPDAKLTASILESSGTNPPTTAFSSRVLRTTSRLRDGQSLVIGGLSELDRTDAAGRTPWLSRIPLVGMLFKDFSYADSDKDLVVVVHPVIVRDRKGGAQLWSFPTSDELLHPRKPRAPGAEEPAEPGSGEASAARASRRAR